MDEDATSATALERAVVADLRRRLPSLAEQTVAAVTAQVPEYATAMTPRMRATIEQAVQAALGSFLQLAEQQRGAEVGTPLQPAVAGAYDLGRGEARSGRSMDALLAAYRVGARVSWRQMSAAAVDGGVLASTIAQFAELVFAYIDQLSAASVAGHADELETSGRVLERYRDRLAAALLDEQDEPALLAAAERAGWEPPPFLAAVLVPAASLRGVAALFDARALTTSGELAGIEQGERYGLLLVPADSGRTQLLRRLSGRPALVGPTRPWPQVASSCSRVVRLLALLADRVVDTDEHLARLVLTADPAAFADLRARARAPLSDLPEATAERLVQTLRSWLLHQGRRAEVARELVVHPQTVRYRMGQLRERYGARLDDPQAVLELTLGLALEPPPAG